VNWISLTGNRNACHLYEDKINRLSDIHWLYLSEKDYFVSILEKNMDKINWQSLSKNPNAIHLLASLDQEKMKENMKDLNEELVSYVFHPQRLIRLSQTYDISFKDLVELF